MSQFNDSWRAGGKGNGPYVLQSRATGQIPLIVKGFLGQTANIFEAQSSVGTILFAIGPTGNLTITGSTTIVIDEAVTGALTVGGLATFNGNTVIGSDSTDTLSVLATATFSERIVATEGINASGTSYFAGTTVFNNAAKFADGTAAYPSITFQDNQDTGVYRSAANTLGFTAAGTSLGTWTTSLLSLNAVQISWSAGVAVTPAQYIITRDADATNQLHFNVPTGSSHEFSINDVAEMVLNAASLNIKSNSLLWDGGVAITPAQYEIARNADATNLLQFNVPTGAGYEWSVNDVAMATLSSVGSFNAGAGTALLPTYSFIGDPNTGMYNGGANSINFATDGVARAGINATAFYSNRYQVYDALTSLVISGGVADGATAIGNKIGNTASLVTPGAKIVSFYSDNIVTERAYFGYLGGLYITQGASASGVANQALTVTGGAHTGITAATEDIGVNFNLSATKTWAAGLVATQREVLIQAPTYATGTFTNAATFAITGAPSGTITNPYTLWVQSGKSLFATVAPAITAANRGIVHFVDNTDNATITYENTSTTGYAGFDFYNQAAVKTATFVWSNATASFLPGSFWFGTRTASSMHFVVNTAVKMTIDSAGLVGINTQANSIAHGDLLHIYNTGTTYSGTLLQRNANTSIAAFRFRTGASTDDFLLGMRGTSDSDFHIYNYGTSADVLNIARTTGITTFSYRVNQKQGTDVASASTIALGNDGNTFEITGTTAVNLITSTGWQNGSKVTLIANENVTINNGTATSGSDITIKLAGAANFGMTANDTLTLVLSETTAGGQAWREIARSAN